MSDKKNKLKAKLRNAKRTIMTLGQTLKKERSLSSEIIRSFKDKLDRLRNVTFPFLDDAVKTLTEENGQLKARIQELEKDAVGYKARIVELDKTVVTWRRAATYWWNRVNPDRSCLDGEPSFEIVNKYKEEIQALKDKAAKADSLEARIKELETNLGNQSSEDAIEAAREAVVKMLQGKGWDDIAHCVRVGNTASTATLVFDACKPFFLSPSPSYSLEQLLQIAEDAYKTYGWRYVDIQATLHGEKSIVTHVIKAIHAALYEPKAKDNPTTERQIIRQKIFLGNSRAEPRLEKIVTDFFAAVMPGFDLFRPSTLVVRPVQESCHGTVLYIEQDKNPAIVSACLAPEYLRAGERAMAEKKAEQGQPQTDEHR